ncbi:MAG: hypothetical protein OEZ43_21530 [Gammaproteobacteria bacterium]|nr:hypothetical protein [Gammaproteobacteria bacterium]
MEAKRDNPLIYKISSDIGFLSYDNNVYRSPDTTYTDYFSKSTGPVSIDPTIQAGFFLPLKTSAKFKLRPKLARNIVLDGGIDYHGKMFSKASLHNANEHRIYSILSIHKLSKLVGKYGGLFQFSSIKQSYVDRDSGQDKTSGVDDISDKYTYKKFGGLLDHKFKTGKITSSNSIGILKRDYIDTVVVSEYDNIESYFKSENKYNISKENRIGFDYQFSNLQYSDKHARRLSGILSSNNPLLRYTYHKLKANWQIDISENISYSSEFINSYRFDEYVSYNSYKLFEFGSNISIKRNKLLLKLEGSFQYRFYQNAYAFDNPIAGKMTYSDVQFSSILTYQVSRIMKLYTKVNFSSTFTSDTRYEYDKELISAGFKLDLKNRLSN